MSDVHNLFANIVQKVSVGNFENISDSLVIAKQFVSTTLQFISEHLRNQTFKSPDTLSSKLEDIVSFLESLISFIHFLIESRSVDANLYVSLPLDVAHILLMVFKHCKDSETLYGSYFTQLHEQIKNTYKKSHKLQVIYFDYVSDHMKFDLSLENQLDTLVKVLGILVEIGEEIITLDTKIVAEHWKNYAKLCEKFKDHIEDNQIVKHINEKTTKILCKELENNLNYLISDQTSDVRVISRTLKLSNFMLKILVKLCEIFDKCFLENYEDIVKCLMFMYTIFLMNSNMLKPTIVEGIRSHINIGCDLLLTNLISHKKFLSCVTKYALSSVNENKHDIGCLLLCIEITKQLLHKNEDIKNQSVNNIVCCIIEIVPSYRHDYMKNIRLESINGEISLYDYVLLHTSCLVISCDQIDKIEVKLFEHLFDSNIWNLLFVHDLWIMLARYSSSEFCFEQLSYLLNFYEKHSKYLHNTPQGVFFKQIIEKLFTFLPKSSKLSTYKEYPIENYPESWKAIGLCNLPIDNMTNEIVIILRSKNSPFAFPEWTVPHTSDEYKLIKNCIQLLSTASLDKLDDNVLTSKIVDFWHCPIMNDTPKEDFVSSICELTLNVALKLNHKSWIQIISHNAKSRQKHTNIATLLLLRYLAYCDNTNDLTSIVTDIFSTLIKDQCDIIRLYAIDSFLHFTSIVSEDVLEDVIKMNPKLMNNVLDILRAHDVLKHNKIKLPKDKFIHKCVRRDKFLGDSETQCLQKDEVTAYIETLKVKAESLKVILEATRFGLHESQKTSLINTRDVLNRLIDF